MDGSGIRDWTRGVRLTGLRLVIVALSMVGLVTAYSAVELFRFGGLTAALRDAISASDARQDHLSALHAALSDHASEGTVHAATARIAAWTPVPPAHLADHARLVVGLSRPSGDPASALFTLRRMMAVETAETRRIQSLWGQASRELSRVLSLTLAAIVVLVATVVLRSLAYLHLRDQTEAALHAATAAARRANAAKSDFLATVSHELRTPLTGVLGYAELLAATDPRPDQRPRIDRLRAAAQTLSALIDDLLDLSRIDAGRMPIVLAPFDLPALLEQVAAPVLPVATKKGLRLTVAPAADLPAFVTGDVRRIAQILLNLLNNAVKFTDEGSVTLSARPDRDGITFAVTDTGIGIAEADLPRLFRRFGQIDTSNSRNHGGTGLGLAISHGLAEAMGGSLSVSSRQGVGSTFSLHVPLPATHAPPAPAEAPPAAHLPARILLIEDSDQNRDIIRAVLERSGHSVTCAGDGIEGLRAARDGDFDLVLMDMQMPRMDGRAATAAIRELPPPKGRVPILALTANVLPDQIAAIRAAGADAHLGKPFTTQDLLSACQALLGTGPFPPPAAAMPDGTSAADFDALVDLLGPVWVAERLQALMDGLDWAVEAPLSLPTSTPPDPDGIRHRAHRLVSDAGQLGLSALSEAAAAVEQAIRAGTDPASAMARLAQASRAARAIHPVLRARLGGHGLKKDRP